LIDLFATITEIVGVPLREGTAEDSLDILPALRSSQPARQEMGYHAVGDRLPLRQGDWAYLRPGGITAKPAWYKEL